MKARTKKFGTRAVAMLLSAMTAFSMFPVSAGAAQVNSYHDPAEHWMQASGRTNELDCNAVVTHETFNCGVCGKATSFQVFRTPEYTRDGQTAMNRNVKYSDGTMVGGSGTGTILDGVPGQNASYTGYHWTKAVCETCGTVNSNMSYASLKIMYHKDWRKIAYLSLAGVFASKRANVVPVALEQFLKDHSQITKVVLHLDIGMMAGSCFGIFFSGEDSGTGMTMRDAAREINQEYNEKIEKIKIDHPYDKLILSGSRATWPEILSIYAVKTTSDQSNGQEVASMNDMKLELLRKVFWDMNSISYRVERHTKGSGKDKTTVVYLYITISHKTTDEMADQYHFNADQKKQLAELLDEKYRSLWSSVLYGIGTGDGEIVTIALSQLGNVGGQPYWSWYGFTSRVEWCACFVSWCANECGYIDAGVIPSFSLCSDGSDWFKARSQWQERDYEPCAGDIIFFDWGGDGVPDHVGIVEKTEGGTVYTVEGNSGDACRENSYPVGDARIYGYGVPMYS